MFNKDFDTLKEENPYWFDPGIIYTLSLVFAVKFIVTIISVSCPIPVGIFMPSVTLGCLIGRLYGEILSKYTIVKQVGGFALVGAACFTACITRTTSVAIIMFELSG